MHAQELGTKRICSSCHAKFYDLQKDPIECPKCHWAISQADLVKQKKLPGKKGGGKEKDIVEELTPAEMANESLIEYELNEDEFGEDLLIEDDKDDEEEDNKI